MRKDSKEARGAMEAELGLLKGEALSCLWVAKILSLKRL